MLFYNLDYYLAHPLEIADGLAAAACRSTAACSAWSWRWCCSPRSRGISALSLFDLVAAVVPIGLFLGRIANFINGELWGRVADVPWAMVFPNGGPEPRHPSQLYEAGARRACCCSSSA